MSLIVVVSILRQVQQQCIRHANRARIIALISTYIGYPLVLTTL